MEIVTSHSPAETEALGEKWGHAAKSGWVIGLSGDLGAGKTQLVKGLARGLGTPARVHSPTFTLVNVYSGGRLPLYHLDLYRLEKREEILGAGLEEYLNPQDGVTVIEWAERLWGQSRVQSPESKGEKNSGLRTQDSGLPGFRARVVKIETIDESRRQITYEDIGD
jgi:tRNA threonylcarbamoyladenosine biosynthesis protein TsaE